MYKVAYTLILAAAIVGNSAFAAAPAQEGKSSPAEPQASTDTGTNQAVDANTDGKPTNTTDDGKKDAKSDKGKKEKKDAKPDKPKKGAKATPYPLETCIVTDNKLDSMGDKTTIIHEGQEIKFCCKPCETKFKKDPARYLPKLKA